MRLGIVVTDERFGRQALGLARAAVQRGWPVRCFFTDTGVRLVTDPVFADVAQQPGVELALCELSLERYGSGGMDPGRLAEQVIVGGQYQDAELVRHSDKVLVF